jgi:murein DD-endopeptidase MepM/ murein hydrolase activator NlpD
LNAFSVTLAAADPIDRSCPNPPPGKPEYNHAYLGGSKWPQPNPDIGDHFWLTKPLPGGGRLLYTDWFPYGYDGGGRYLLHNGLDMGEPLGTPVLAVADGTVLVAGDDLYELYGWRCDWYGHLVVIELADKWEGKPVYVLYGHVLGIKVVPGEQVQRGQQVAEVGVGGVANEPHLHFEIRVGTNDYGSTRNPLLWLAPPASRGIVAGRLVDPQGRPWQGMAVQAIGLSDGTQSATTWSYLGDMRNLINPDQRLAENFVVGDLVPGLYEILVEVQGITYSQQVEVTAGQLSTVEIVTEPYRSEEPVPSS